MFEMKRFYLYDLVPCLLLAGLCLIVADASRLANRTKGHPSRTRPKTRVPEYPSWMKGATSAQKSTPHQPTIDDDDNDIRHMNINEINPTNGIDSNLNINNNNSNSNIVADRKRRKGKHGSKKNGTRFSKHGHNLKHSRVHGKHRNSRNHSPSSTTARLRQSRLQRLKRLKRKKSNLTTGATVSYSSAEDLWTSTSIEAAALTAPATVTTEASSPSLSLVTEPLLSSTQSEVPYDNSGYDVSEIIDDVIETATNSMPTVTETPQSPEDSTATFATPPSITASPTAAASNATEVVEVVGDTNRYGRFSPVSIPDELLELFPPPPLFNLPPPPPFITEDCGYVYTWQLVKKSLATDSTTSSMTSDSTTKSPLPSTLETAEDVSTFRLETTSSSSSSSSSSEFTDTSLHLTPPLYMTSHSSGASSSSSSSSSSSPSSSSSSSSLTSGEIHTQSSPSSSSASSSSSSSSSSLSSSTSSYSTSSEFTATISTATEVLILTDDVTSAPSSSPSPAASSSSSSSLSSSPTESVTTSQPLITSEAVSSSALASSQSSSSSSLSSSSSSSPTESSSFTTLTSSSSFDVTSLPSPSSSSSHTSADSSTTTHFSTSSSSASPPSSSLSSSSLSSVTPSQPSSVHSSPSSYHHTITWPEKPSPDSGNQIGVKSGDVLTTEMSEGTTSETETEITTKALKKPTKATKKPKAKTKTKTPDSKKDKKDKKKKKNDKKDKIEKSKGDKILFTTPSVVHQERESGSHSTEKTHSGAFVTRSSSSSSPSTILPPSSSSSSLSITTPSSLTPSPVTSSSPSSSSSTFHLNISTVPQCSTGLAATPITVQGLPGPPGPRGPPGLNGMPGVMLFSSEASMERVRLEGLLAYRTDIKTLFLRDDKAWRAFRLAVCGDGIVDPGEQCDDGNGYQHDDCAACKWNICGDGFRNYRTEECDGNDFGSVTCAHYPPWTKGQLKCSPFCRISFVDCH